MWVLVNCRLERFPERILMHGISVEFPWNFFSSSLGNFAWAKAFEMWPWEVPVLSGETGCTTEGDFWLFPLLSWASKTDSNSTIHPWKELISSQLSQTSVSITLTSSTRSTISRSSDWSSEYFVSRAVRRNFSLFTSMRLPSEIFKRHGGKHSCWVIRDQLGFGDE